MRSRLLQFCQRALLTVVIAGCGGGSGDSTNSGGGAPAGGSLTADQRFAALGAVQAKYTELKKQSGVDVNQVIADYLRTRPEFSEVGVTAESTVWATFTDGRELTIFNNRTLTAGLPAQARPTERPLANDLPSGTKALVGNSFGAYPPARSVVADVASLLAVDGFPSVTTRSNMSVAELKNRFDLGVLFLHGHSGPGKTGVFALTTATIVTQSDDPDFKDDMDNQRVRYAMADFPDGLNGEIVQNIHYSITAKFVQTYMSFSKNSVVFLHGCDTGSGPAQAFRAAFTEKGAGLVVGWDHRVDDSANEAVRYYFDRMIGANTVNPKEDPPQRPFDHLAVVADMTRAKLLPSINFDDKGNKISANLTGLAGAGDYALLAPTIRRLTVSEQQKTLTIDGLFGLDPGLADSKVTIGGKEMNSRIWGSDQIVVNQLPDSGDGASGDVIVEVRKHPSNPVQLTLWKINFNTLHRALAPEPEDSLKQEGVMAVHFRADVHSFRDEPHAAPIEPFVTFNQIADSFGTYTASGKLLNRETGDLIDSWSGTAIVPALGVVPGGKNTLFCHGTIDVKGRRIVLGLLGAAVEGMFSTSPPEGPTPLPGITGPLDGAFGGGDVGPALFLTLNSDFSIAAGASDAPVGPLLWRVTWDKADPIAPPGSKAAR